MELISRQDAIDALKGLEFCQYMEFGEYIGEDTREVRLIRAEKAQDALQKLPSAQPEQRYTEEELRVFAHGISLSLLSKRSAQHWQYDEDTATEIEFLERLYDKVSAGRK